MGCSYYSLWQWCAQCQVLQLDVTPLLQKQPRPKTVNATWIAAPLKLAASPSASTSASLKIAIKKSTTPRTGGTGPLYTKLQRRTMLLWQKPCLQTLPIWTALTSGVQQLFIGLRYGAVLMWPNSFLQTLPMWTALTMMVQQLFIGLHGTTGLKWPNSCLQSLPM